MNKLKKAMKAFLNHLGYEVCKVNNIPYFTLCGLDALSINSIIDVGANTGQFARYVSKFFPDAQIICYEPLPEPFEELKKWASSQNGRIHVFNLGIGEKAGQQTINIHTDHTPSSSFLGTTSINEAYHPQIKQQETLSVTMTTLDDQLDNISRYLSDNVLIKIDVQGYEDRVLRGANNILKKVSVCILEINLESLYQGQADFLNLAKMLYKYGFKYAGNLYQACDVDGRIIYLDAVFKK